MGGRGTAGTGLRTRSWGFEVCSLGMMMTPGFFTLSEILVPDMMMITTILLHNVMVFTIEDMLLVGIIRVDGNGQAAVLFGSRVGRSVDTLATRSTHLLFLGGLFSLLRGGGGAASSRPGTMVSAAKCVDH